jgi:adenine deaminase
VTSAAYLKGHSGAERPDDKEMPQWVSGTIMDIVAGRSYPGTLEIRNGRISEIKRGGGTYDTFIVPGLIDAHVHIESSMMVPSEFARLAVRHGTVATVSDPHEIANVLGIRGIDFMLDNGRQTGFKFYFGAPSCVPATAFETSGASIGPGQIEELLKREDIKYLSEMMNYPGVLYEDKSVMKKIAIAKKYGKRIDGHAPGLRGSSLRKYIGCGITTDHETFSYEEGLEKIKNGMKVQIREGSAAKNLDELLPLLDEFPDSCMFCSDDKHPNDLVLGHINGSVRRALSRGIDPMKVLRCASLNPVRHYDLEVGLLQKGDCADFVVVDDLKHFNILKTFIDGRLVAEAGKTLLPRVSFEALNNFAARKKRVEEFSVMTKGSIMNVIEAEDGQLITKRLRKALREPAKDSGIRAVSDVGRDILKIAVVNRYHDAPPSIGFIRNIGLKKGAIASSFAHDSHNIVAAGVTDEDIARAVNIVIANRGGLSVVYDDKEKGLPLPVAGLMSDRDGFEVAEKYSELDGLAKGLGSKLTAPFMTLSFVALLVIPEIKLGDKGLFDSRKFDFMPLFE